MTENKRFEMKCHEINSWYIEKDGGVLIFDLVKSDAEILYNELNNLNDENEQLKEFIKTLATCNKILLSNGNVYDVRKIIGDGV